MTTKGEMMRRAAVLARVEVLVETNAGTYGAEEAARKVGTGDSRHADYRVYERVGGGRRYEGALTSEAPGYGRKMGEEALRTKRAELAALRKAISAVK